MSKAGQTIEVPLSQVRAADVALRGVDKESEQYKSLVKSVKADGIMSNIQVREKIDEQTNEGYYEVINGLQRFSAAGDCGMESIVVKVMTATELEALTYQIVANLVKVDTKPAAYAEQLQRMMALEPTLTKADIAARVSQSTDWVDNRLGLLKLTKELQTLVDEKKIPLQSAIALKDLTHDIQIEYMEAAMAQTAAEFVPTITQRLKDIRAARLAGRPEGGPVFTPTPSVRPAKEGLAELESRKAASEICARENIVTATDGFAEGVRWALSMDKDAVAAKKAKFDQKQKELSDAKARRDEEKAQKKLVDAQKEAAKFAPPVAAVTVG